MTTTVVPLLKQVYKQLSDGIINLLFFQCHVNLHKKKTPYQGGDQMRKKKKQKKNKELLNLTIKGKAEEGIIRGIIKALYILQDESARSLC